MTCKPFLAHAALRNRDLFKLDIFNAYMALPTCIKDKHGDDGSELCIQLSTPCWGEQEVGFEWQKAFEKTLLGAGWTPAEGVPCLWYFLKADGLQEVP